MDNKFLNNIKDIIPFLIPIILLSQGRKEFKLDVKLDGNYEDRVKMLEDIKPYFDEHDQRTLGKVQDIFDILSKLNRIIKSEYDEHITSLGNAMSSIDKRERILSHIAEYMGGKNKQLAEEVVTVKQNIYQTQANIEEYKQSVATQKMDGLSSIIRLANSIEPLMRDIDKKKIKKIERIAKILKTPVDHS